MKLHPLNTSGRRDKHVEFQCLEGKNCCVRGEFSQAGGEREQHTHSLRKRGWEPRSRMGARIWVNLKK